MEVNGARERERPIRAGLPQGRLLASTLHALWLADLITDHLRRMADEERLVDLPEDTTCTWTNGSAEGGVWKARGGEVSMLHDGDTREVRVATGALCSSTRADLIVLKVTLEELFGGPRCIVTAMIEDRDAS